MKLQQFNILFGKNDTLLDRVIKHKLQTQYSHVDLILDEFHVVSTAWNFPISVRHLDFSLGNFDGYMIPNFTKHHKEKIVEFIQRTLNSKYDFAEIFNYFGFGFKDSKNRYVCISWIDKVLSVGEVKVVKDIEVYKFEDLIEKYGLEKINK